MRLRRSVPPVPTDVSIFCKKSAFLVKVKPFLNGVVWELCYRFSNSVFSFCKIKGCYKWKCRNYRPCAGNPGSGLLQINYQLEKWRRCHNLPTRRHRQFFWRCRVSLVKLSSLVICPSFMLILWLFLELWQPLLIRNLAIYPEIGKTPSEFCLISGDWAELGIPIWHECLQ